MTPKPFDPNNLGSVGQEAGPLDHFGLFGNMGAHAEPKQPDPIQNMIDSLKNDLGSVPGGIPHVPQGGGPPPETDHKQFSQYLQEMTHDGTPAAGQYQRIGSATSAAAGNLARRVEELANTVAGIDLGESDSPALDAIRQVLRKNVDQLHELVDVYRGVQNGINQYNASVQFYWQSKQQALDKLTALDDNLPAWVVKNGGAAQFQSELQVAQDNFVRSQPPIQAGVPQVGRHVTPLPDIPALIAPPVNNPTPAGNLGSVTNPYASSAIPTGIPAADPAPLTPGPSPAAPGTTPSLADILASGVPVGTGGPPVPGSLIPGNQQNPGNPRNSPTAMPGQQLPGMMTDSDLASLLAARNRNSPSTTTAGAPTDSSVPILPGSGLGDLTAGGPTGPGAPIQPPSWLNASTGDAAAGGKAPGGPGAGGGPVEGAPASRSPMGGGMPMMPMMPATGAGQNPGAGKADRPKIRNVDEAMYGDDLAKKTTTPVVQPGGRPVQPPRE